MGSSQSALDRAYEAKATQLKQEMKNKKRDLELLEGWVKVHNDMKEENLRLKTECADQKVKIEQGETQMKFQVLVD